MARVSSPGGGQSRSGNEQTRAMIQSQEKPSDQSSSCYTIHTLDSSNYTPKSSTLGLRVIVLLLIFSISTYLIVRFTTKPNQRASPINNTVLETITPAVRFDYNQEPNELVPQTSEYVRLYKLPPPLDNDDINEKYVHHRFSIHHYYNTGVFRPPKSKLWDPHPQYIFHAFNKRFHLVLNQISKKHSFLIPGFKVTTHSGNDRESWVTRDNEKNDDSFEGCFYNGYVLGDIESSVAVSLCSGMTGHIRTSDGSYFIEPRAVNSPEHEIYQIRGPQRNAPPMPSTRNTSTLQITNEPYYSDEDYDSEEEVLKTRSKRSLSTERYVELTVVTDQTMSSYHGDNLKHYVLTLLSIVALVYRDASIGNPVNIVLVNFHVLTDTDFSGANSANKTHGTSASEMLRNFCKWQKEHNHPDDRHALHHDTALLLTRETICRNPWVGKCDTLGLAELGTMCDHYASCAIVQDNGLSAAFTIAHELGHVLNMPHDDDYKCQSFVDRSIANGDRDESSSSEDTRTRNLDKTSIQHYVMSRMLDHNTYPWAWSRCSRHFLTEFLDAGHGYCLEDKPDSNLLYNDDENSVDDDALSGSSVQQPGEIFSEHKQCELVFGPNSQLCSYMPPCRRLWCTNHGGPESEESEGCRTQHMPWADGTRCGSNKWCQRGQCVLKDLEKLKIINGGWGSWQDYGECSRECGGGVRKSFRECDNPKPRNGGKYCVGPRVKYESCNTHECANTSISFDFRASQCAAFNGDNFNINGLPEDVTWVPKYNGISPKDMCKLFCRVHGSSSYYLLKEKVIDGTPCGIDTFDVCVNGACLPAGCDRRLHSSKTLDICGVCGGDGSTCTTSQGSYNSTKYGYNAVVTIPSGASNIDIRQRSYDNSARDDNYLALLDPITSEYVLNGHFVVSMFRKTIHYGGSVLEYSGSDQIVERINSSSRPLKRDLEIRILSVGKLKPPDIVFQYVISSENVTEHDSFEWIPKIEGSTTCTTVCNGTTIPYVYECVRKSNSRITVVQSSYCDNIRIPPHDPKPCNTHCTLAYRLVCPESCSRNHTTECTRTVHATNTTQKISESYCVKSGITKPHPPDCLSECRNKPPKWRFTQWSECGVRGSNIIRCGTSPNVTGHQIRNVWCQRFNWRSLVDSSVDNYEVVDDRECIQDKPINRRNCRMSEQPNTICGEWKIDQWSPCSTTCGPGRTRALYACMLLGRSTSQILPPDYCVHVPKPIVERPCEVIPCARYTNTNWSECDCERNTQTRNITCMVNNSPSPNTSVCERLNVQKPEYSRECTESCKYKISNWSDDCRLYNSKVYRYRTVSCDFPVCTGPKPNSMQECGEWVFESSWSGCNGSCSVGVETRNVACYLRGIRVNESACAGVVGGKPISERKCYHNCVNGKNSARSLRMGGRGEEGYGGVAKTTPPYYVYNIQPFVPVNDSYVWVAGPWGKCGRVRDNSCVGEFIKKRQVKCVHESRRSTSVPTSYCLSPISPDTSNCTEQEIKQVPGCNYWRLSEWTNCTIPVNKVENCEESKNILQGVKKRIVECVVDTSNEVVEDQECSESKPEEIEACAIRYTTLLYAQACDISYKWKLGNWSNCVVETGKCGKGRKSRHVACVRVWNNRETNVSEHYCTKRKNKRGMKSRAPKQNKECTKPCKDNIKYPHFKWISSSWSNCSRSCGGYGLSSRRVRCHRTNKHGWTDPEPLPHAIASVNNSNYCPPPKPKEYDYCMVSESCDDMPPPPNYRWDTTEWTKCNCPNTTELTRSYSVEKRKVFCTQINTGSKVPAKYCANFTKPPRKQKCECNVFRTCAEMRDALSKNFMQVIDKQYTLLVGGTSVNIYCHGMTDLDNKPKEYLTVNEDNNFSEIYDKRLIRPETCPRNGTRMTSCECVMDRNRRVGHTTFRRLRLNVTNLQIDVDDFTFAVSSQDLISYATGGDCYSSSMICPQGRFAIDLRTTGLAVSSLTSWSTTGHRSTMRVVRKNFGGNSVSQYIQGKCGGYCGTCTVSKSIGLRVDVV
ncbi:unnamed protein product [Orchesella dallaii]|uniref:A disintegrin and metalloproteinase with thrombospondin motifs 9 n=1 Tax=Orchesella dallaii TaxID=48710 RepID=A0ABP1QRY0_9HEXA